MGKKVKKLSRKKGSSPKDSNELKMTFDPNTIEHLGVRMYSTLPSVIAELVANAYDADAKKVDITLNDENPEEKDITIEDDGIGMSFEEINDNFLRIGKNRRTVNGGGVTLGRRKVIGKKGLGKLSFFGIAGEVEISTFKDGKENTFLMVWDDIKAAKHDYKPRIIKHNSACDTAAVGTKIVLKKIQRKSDFYAEELASSLSKFFIVDTDFQISIKRNSEEPVIVSNELRYSGLDSDVEWNIPEDYEYSGDYPNKDDIKGHLIATKKPIPPSKNMRGITLFSRKKLVNNPEYFTDSTSSHFFSYLTGWLEVDFIDELPEDVISTNRQSLNWGHEETEKLKEYLRGMINWLERDWRKKRKGTRKKAIADATHIDLDRWFSKLPENIRALMEPVIESIIEEGELPNETNSAAVKNIHEIVPEYPYYHWRQLHPKIQEVSENDYRNRDYYRAFQEAVKAYINEVKLKSQCTNRSDSGMMGEVFGAQGGRTTSLLVANNFIRPSSGNAFAGTTIDSIEDGQKHLSIGVVSGCRNPVSHELITDLRESGLFTEKDCLDALSLLSHLFNRLDNASVITNTTNP